MKRFLSARDFLSFLFIPKAFKGYRIQSKSLLRITRSADIDADALYDEEMDYREFMEGLMKKRRRLEPVRIELSRELDRDIVEHLCELIDIDKKAVFSCGTPLDLSFVFQFQDILRQHSEFFYEKRVPQKSTRFRDGEAFLPQILEKDHLLSYPFDCMTPFLRMLREAASDPKVVSIKMTLYRMAKQSEIVSTLIEAAENGKEVLVLVEAAAPIWDPDIRQQIRFMFDTMLRDNCQARQLQPDGQYVRLKPEENENPVNSQELFFEKAYEQARNVSAEE